MMNAVFLADAFSSKCYEINLIERISPQPKCNVGEDYERKRDYRK